ncbi:hypothetical protein SDC9_119903 [bioreactor metagenome]|uniref:Uncharacterized protein n=1 Tax=bioreactor metagenome TaxID=1076179 RepID=A0A645C6Z0_9ZZZZ
MNHVPFCFLHAHNSLPDFDVAQCAKATGKCQVENVDQKRHGKNEDNNRQRVAEEFLAREPCELFHFAYHLAEEADEADFEHAVHCQNIEQGQYNRDDAGNQRYRAHLGGGGQYDDGVDKRERAKGHERFALFLEQTKHARSNDQQAKQRACDLQPNRERIRLGRGDHLHNVVRGEEKPAYRKKNAGGKKQFFGDDRPKRLLMYAVAVRVDLCDLLLRAFGILLRIAEILCHIVPLSSYPLFGFAMRRVLAAETAVLAELQPLRVVLLVLVGVVVPLLALGASQGDLYACICCHGQTLRKFGQNIINRAPLRGTFKRYHSRGAMSISSFLITEIFLHFSRYMR